MDFMGLLNHLPSSKLSPFQMYYFDSVLPLSATVSLIRLTISVGNSPLGLVQTEQ